MIPQPPSGPRRRSTAGSALTHNKPPPLDTTGPLADSTSANLLSPNGSASRGPAGRALPVHPHDAPHSAAPPLVRLRSGGGSGVFGQTTTSRRRQSVRAMPTTSDALSQSGRSFAAVTMATTQHLRDEDGAGTSLGGYAGTGIAGLMGSANAEAGAVHERFGGNTDATALRPATWDCAIGPPQCRLPSMARWVARLDPGAALEARRKRVWEAQREAALRRQSTDAAVGNILRPNTARTTVRGGLSHEHLAALSARGSTTKSPIPSRPTSHAGSPQRRSATASHRTASVSQAPSLLNTSPRRQAAQSKAAKGRLLALSSALRSDLGAFVQHLLDAAGQKLLAPHLAKFTWTKHACWELKRLFDLLDFQQVGALTFESLRRAALLLGDTQAVAAPPSVAALAALDTDGSGALDFLEVARAFFPHLTVRQLQRTYTPQFRANAASVRAADRLSAADLASVEVLYKRIAQLPGGCTPDNIAASGTTWLSKHVELVRGVCAEFRASSAFAPHSSGLGVSFVSRPSAVAFGPPSGFGHGSFGPAAIGDSVVSPRRNTADSALVSAGLDALTSPRHTEGGSSEGYAPPSALVTPRSRSSVSRSLAGTRRGSRVSRGSMSASRRPSFTPPRSHNTSAAHSTMTSPGRGAALDSSGSRRPSLDQAAVPGFPEEPPFAVERDPAAQPLSFEEFVEMFKYAYPPFSSEEETHGEASVEFDPAAFSMRAIARLRGLSHEGRSVPSLEVEVRRIPTHANARQRRTETRKEALSVAGREERTQGRASKIVEPDASTIPRAVSSYKVGAQYREEARKAFRHQSPPPTAPARAARRTTFEE